MKITIWSIADSETYFFVHTKFQKVANLKLTFLSVARTKFQKFKLNKVFKKLLKHIQNGSHLKVLVARNTNMQTKLNLDFWFKRYNRFRFQDVMKRYGRWGGWSMQFSHKKHAYMRGNLQPNGRMGHARDIMRTVFFFYIFGGLK